jgi:hypothetical protein
MAWGVALAGATLEYRGLLRRPVAGGRPQHAGPLGFGLRPASLSESGTTPDKSEKPGLLQSTAASADCAVARGSTELGGGSGHAAGTFYTWSLPSSLPDPSGEFWLVGSATLGRSVGLLTVG